MSRTLLNFWLDAVLLLVFLATVWAAFVVRFVFPPGTVADGWSLWGASFDQWLQLQFVLQCVMAFAILLHLMLHWNWVCGVISGQLLRRTKNGRKQPRSDGARTLYGVGLMVVIFHLLGIGLAAAKLMVESP